MTNIESSFRRIRLMLAAFVCCCTLITGYSLWSSYSFAEKQREKIYVLDGGKSLMLVANLAASPYLGDAGIYIDYTFMGTEHTDKYIGDVANFLPMSGTIYTVELNFIGDAFVISFVVDNNQTWENGGDSDLEFE